MQMNRRRGIRTLDWLPTGPKPAAVDLAWLSSLCNLPHICMLFVAQRWVEDLNPRVPQGHNRLATYRLSTRPTQHGGERIRTSDGASGGGF